MTNVPWGGGKLTQLKPIALGELGLAYLFLSYFSRGNPKPSPIEKHWCPVHSLQKGTDLLPWLLAFSSETLTLILFSVSSLE